MIRLATLIILLIMPSCGTFSHTRAERDLYLIEGYVDIGDYHKAEKFAKAVRPHDLHYKKSRVWLDIIYELRSNPKDYAIDKSYRFTRAMILRKFTDAGIAYP